MGKSCNVRVENGFSFNIGSLNLKKALLIKAKQHLGDRSDSELNLSVKEILKTGKYEMKNLEDGSMVHLFHGEEICIELNSTAKAITNIYPNEEKGKLCKVPEKEIQQGSSLKLVKLSEPSSHKREFSIEKSFIESSISLLYNKLLELEDYSRTMNQSLSKTDKEISKIYHELETTNFNASRGYFYAKSLQGLLRKRRFIKTELDKIHSTSKEFKQMKELVLQSEKKVLNKQSQYESYSEGWGLNLKDFVE